MFLRYQNIALDVSHGFGRNRSMSLIVAFLIKKESYKKACLVQYHCYHFKHTKSTFIKKRRKTFCYM